MKLKKIVVVLVATICTIVAIGVYYFYALKQKAKSEQTKIFLNNIKVGKKNQMEIFSSGIDKFENYDFEVLKAKEVISLADNKIYKLSELLNKPNLYINFCLVESGHCDIEMSMMQQFYDKYKDKISFIVLSEEEDVIVRKFLEKYKFTMPFYVLKNDKFPVGIKFYATSHLIINNKTQFMYAGVGYYDNDGFNHYIDSVLVK